MKPEELFRRVVEGHRANVRFANFCKLVEDFGFELRRVKGSHHIYVHPLVRDQLNIQPLDGDAKPVQIAQFLKVLEEYEVQSPYDRADA